MTSEQAEPSTEGRTKVLVLSPMGCVSSPSSGSQARVSNLLDQLARRTSFEVDLLEYSESAQKDRGSPESDRFSIRGFGAVLPDNLNDFNPSLYALLFAYYASNTPDIVQVEGCSGMVASRIVDRVHGNTAKIVYDAHNVEAERIKNHKAPSLPYYKRLASPIVIPLVERASVRLSDHILAVSEEDKATFTERYNVTGDEITVIQSGVSITSPPTVEEKPAQYETYNVDPEKVTLVFHGSYSYYPNREAMNIIIEDIGPKITAEYDDVEFVLAGKDLPRYQSDQICCAGFVPDLSSFLAVSDIAVVPLQRGGGTKLKMLDYLNAGLPIVTTHVGAEGLAIEHNQHALVTDGVDEEFVANIRHLLDVNTERKRLGEAARMLAVERYDWDHIGSKLARLYKSL